jgi:S1-C subfamily serine protease
MKRTMSMVLAAVAAGALAGGVVAALVADGDSSPSAPPIPAQPAGVATDGALTPQQIYARDTPGVVVITATDTKKIPATVFAPAHRESVESLGSGFVIDKKGDILTNQHVIAGSNGIRVGFSGGATYPATVVGSDASTDLAVVRVKVAASALHPLGFDDSAAARGGDPVYAIGNPFGLDRTMTAGIVSATGRDIDAPNGVSIPKAIQTDAAINHGNSGGPLLDARGRAIGVNAQIEGGTVDGNVGIGFAIPSNTAKAIATQLIAHGRAAHAWLGVEVTAVDPGLARAVPGLPSRGVGVARVLAGGPAATAGLHGPTRGATVDGVSVPVGADAIVAIDGTAIHTPADVAAAIAAHRPGDRVRVAVLRHGTTRHLQVTLGNAPAGA